MDIGRAQLEEDVPGLLARADQAYTKSRSVRISANAAAGLEKADRIQPGDVEVLWRMARAYITLANAVPDRSLRRRLAETALARTKDCGREATVPGMPPLALPACLYFEAASAGIAASLNPTPTPADQRAVETPAQRLVLLDPRYEKGGGLRILGALYARAPAWPAGVGDLEEAVDLLERAVQMHPEHPLNHFFLAEAYARAGRIRDATVAYRTVLKAPSTGEWALIGRTYRALARDRFESLTHEMTP